MELLTIFYAMLAALTGVSVGEGTSARQPLVAAAQAQQVEVAIAAARKIAPAVVEFGHRFGRPINRQRPSVVEPSAPPPAMRQVAIIIFGRRHL